ncbi:hypothetical protein D9M68_482190 [compost metagenome]
MLRLVLGQAQGLAQGQAQGEVDHQVEAEHADDGVFHRTDLAGCRVVGRGGPADHLGGQGGIGFDHARDVFHRGVGIDPQLDDALRRFRQRRDLDGFLQALLDAPGSEGLHGLGDLGAVVAGAVEVGADGRQGLTEAGGAGLAQQAAIVLAGQFQEHAGLAGLHQQVRLLQQAFVIQARGAGQRRQAGQGAQLVLAEHALQALRLDRYQLAAGEFGKAVEVEQLAARVEHQQGADRILEEHGLDPLRGRQAGVIQADLEGQAELLEHLHDHRGRLWRGIWGESDFGHGSIQLGIFLSGV